MAVDRVADELRTGHRVPGLGHRLHPGEDSRVCALLALLEEVPGAAPALAAAHDDHHRPAHPLHADVDLAPAVLTVSSGMSASRRRSSPSPGRRDGSPTPRMRREPPQHSECAQSAPHTHHRKSHQTKSG